MESTIRIVDLEAETFEEIGVIDITFSKFYEITKISNLLFFSGYSESKIRVYDLNPYFSKTSFVMADLQLQTEIDMNSSIFGLPNNVTFLYSHLISQDFSYLFLNYDDGISEKKVATYQIT